MAKLKNDKGLQTHAKKYGKLGKEFHLEPMQVDILVRRQEGGAETTPFPLYAPHELLHCLYTSLRPIFDKAFVGPAGALRSYWSGAQKELWFNEHPLRERILDNVGTVLPLRLHGDGAPVTKVLSSLAVSIGSPISALLPSQQSVFHFTAWCSEISWTAPHTG